ncbi:bifunctional precorrin-2 dehydrogenase/sirohydrochlorin ferrochelatase [candidate division KSB1 bacterium]|nr:bifunctional precorrin-2 dehydrogenase/sirohydrochlorin ferrochelatase [candidate division KSB1 bacterium]
MSALYPVYIKLEHQPCLVVGGGRVAERKVERLLKSGAEVTVVSPDLTPELEKWAMEKKITWIARPFQTDDAKTAFLTIAATDDETINRLVESKVRAMKRLINVVDVPDQCNFYVPSIVERGDLMIAISTNGKSPALARYLKEKIYTWLPKDIDRDLEQLGQDREEQKKSTPDIELRKQRAEQLAQKIINRIETQDLS